MKVWDYKSNSTDALSKKLDRDPTIAFTKPTMAKYLISCIDFRPGDVVMEPCRGPGAFYDNLPSHVSPQWCEINEGRDYLKYQGSVDITLSNPPFVPRKLFWAFHQKAMETTDREIWWLINFSSLNVFTPKRLQEMKDKQWFLPKCWIVGDKRWYGRYCWLKIGRNAEDGMIGGWHKKGF